jgi:hypothetical protein
MTGSELRELLVQKWGHPYDLQLRKVQDKIYIQVMWRYLGQASFPKSDAEYMGHLEAIATYINAWDCQAYVQQFIAETRDRPRLGKAVNIPIELGDRTSEWIL